MIKMKWYKSIEFWLGVLIMLAFFQMFFVETFSFMWWSGLISSIVGMLLLFNVFGKLNIK
ncbi:hypothetical protein FD29_GL000322 [Companilactobacillus mindensis DSM 14500]|uniref:Uncharacterized protein n=2 Tax=Companilactobacillus mindensis TaxID=167481 RepID=A0A0R1QVN2_9LACO|nr:hypothetical protein FD29_GL000322 [Companilactobacillus mindensis DSM 14500]